MKFSVLMSLYAKERPEFLVAALESLRASEVRPEEVVMVLDGPIGGENQSVLDDFLPLLPLHLVPLPANVGLGRALNAGLAACRNEWVARFDTDDLVCPGRFGKQLAFIESHPEVDIVGTAIAEFDTDPSRITAVRRAPCVHDEIIRFARKRNPFNHMTVMYKRRAVMSCGGYGSELLYEDYALWVRMLQAGFRGANLEDRLVRVRVGRDMLARRGGYKYAVNEVRAQRAFLRSGFITGRQFAINVVQRLPIRVSPAWVRKAVYGLIRALPLR